MTCWEVNSCEDDDRHKSMDVTRNRSNGTCQSLPIHADGCRAALWWPPEDDLFHRRMRGGSTGWRTDMYDAGVTGHDETGNEESVHHHTGEHCQMS